MFNWWKLYLIIQSEKCVDMTFDLSNSNYIIKKIENNNLSGKNRKIWEMSEILKFKNPLIMTMQLKKKLFYDKWLLLLFFSL